MHAPPGVDGGPSAARRVGSTAHGMLHDPARLARALFRAGEHGLTRRAASPLDALEAAPLRVTKLATHTGVAQPRGTVPLQKREDRELVARRRCTTDPRALETTLAPAVRRLLEQGRQRMPAAPPDTLHTTTVDTCERAVCAAPRAVATLVETMDSEAL